MELWFWFAVAAAVLGGIPSFMMKMAAHRNYNSELFVLYGATSSVIVMTPIAMLLSGMSSLSWTMMTFAAIGGMVASLGGIFRINALRHVDTTIYYPLVKLLSPFLAIVFGIIFFSESFSSTEWLGLIMGLFVPLMLISRKENGRQNNLAMGLILVGVTGVISAMVAAINKYVSDIYGDVFWILAAASLGVFVGSVLFIMWKQGLKNLKAHIYTDTTKDLAVLALTRGVVISTSFGCMIYAFTLGGTLAIVHTIHSLYILIPIVLAIIFYKEHWNTQKVIAIILSVAALAMLQ